MRTDAVVNPFSVVTVVTKRLKADRKIVFNKPTIKVLTANPNLASVFCAVIIDMVYAQELGIVFTTTGTKTTVVVEAFFF